jgi:release factor glutamine methyltransferase
MATSRSNHSLITAELRKAGCVFAEEEARLLISEAKTNSELNKMVRQRIAGDRLEHILGWAEFCGLRIAVAPGVFVPRHRTEWLVRQAIALTPPKAVVVDLCCGSGALGSALAKAVGHIELYAADIDPRSVDCARGNIAAVDGTVFEGDLFDPLPDALKGRINVLLANVPYVPTKAIEFLPREARLHEPHVALDGGADGLDLLRRVAIAAPQWLAPGGQLLIETSQDQAPQAVAIFARNGLMPKVASSDELNATVVIGTKPK